MSDKELYGLYKINKSKIKKEITSYLWAYHPDMVPVLTSSIWRDLFHFISGYVSCLFQMGESPIMEKEIDALLVDVTTDYLINNLLK